MDIMKQHHLPITHGTQWGEANTIIRLPPQRSLGKPSPAPKIRSSRSTGVSFISAPPFNSYYYMRLDMKKNPFSVDSLYFFRYNAKYMPQ